MNKILSLTTFILIFSVLRLLRAEDGVTETGDQASKNLEEINFEKFREECNKTNAIDMTYYEALGKTGSFPDEKVRSPKCFLRCVMLKTGSMSSTGKIDPERASVVYSIRKGHVVQDVQEKAAACAEIDDTCECEKAYKFIKCMILSGMEKDDTKN